MECFQGWTADKVKRFLGRMNAYEHQFLNTENQFLNTG